MTAYTLQDDALNTGELDYINGGIHTRAFILSENSSTSRSSSWLIARSCLHAVAVDDDERSWPMQCNATQLCSGVGPVLHRRQLPGPAGDHREGGLRQGRPPHRAPVHRQAVVRGHPVPRRLRHAAGLRQGLQEAGGLLRPPHQTTRVSERSATRRPSHRRRRAREGRVLIRPADRSDEWKFSQSVAANQTRLNAENSVRLHIALCNSNAVY